ncbi:MAG: holo-ACP synthase [bacterium]|nr:holo-ACP synthase [bacterium]
MITTGIDLVEIKRIKKSFENPLFFQRVFGDTEKQFLNSLNGQRFYCSAAARFAAKEAFSKALRTGVSGFSLCEVEVVNDKSGAPELKLSGNAKKLAKGFSFSISLTHTESYASAIVIAVKENDYEDSGK